MVRTACTELQHLYKGAFYLYLYLYLYNNVATINAVTSHLIFMTQQTPLFVHFYAKKHHRLPHQCAPDLWGQACNHVGVHLCLVNIFMKCLLQMFCRYRQEVTKTDAQTSCVDITQCDRQSAGSLHTAQHAGPQYRNIYIRRTLQLATKNLTSPKQDQKSYKSKTRPKILQVQNKTKNLTSSKQDQKSYKFKIRPKILQVQNRTKNLTSSK